VTDGATRKVAQVAEEYYDSDAADRFYATIWGGEDIHIGIYESPSEPIQRASRRTVERLAQVLSPEPGARILDLGAGYGGAARYLVDAYDCRVDCLNISEVQNRRNQQLTAALGMSHAIEVIHASFEDIPRPDGCYDAVWSQDAFLHSGARRRVLAEVERVLRPGGSLIFTDPMRADDCPEGVLGSILERIHLSDLGSFAWYREEARKLGFVEVRTIALTEQLVRHYSRVREELASRYDAMVRLSHKDYVDRMLTGLSHWIDGGKRGHLAWGILHFRAP
jgi:sarcosine/dimethylglycine N-methyltransferase